MYCRYYIENYIEKIMNHYIKIHLYSCAECTLASVLKKCLQQCPIGLVQFLYSAK